MAFLAALTAAPALADHYVDDAGTGQDAGNTQADALLLPSYGTYLGYLAPRDWDWYRVEAPASAPQCIEATATGDNNDTLRLTLDSPDRTRTLQGAFAAGESRTLAIAVPTLTRAYFDITASPNSPNEGDPARPGHYRFTLAATGVPSRSMGDALTGMDAGDHLGEATPAPGPCFGGRIDPLRQMGDMRDVYALTGTAGQVITYGFATNLPPDASGLTLLAANGTALGPTLKSGQYAQVTLPDDGTYYLSAAAAGLSTQSLEYVISYVIGPPDPGNPCRPQC